MGGIWGGCDENQPLIDKASGEYNGGAGFHKDIWRKIMSRVHEGLPDIGFTQPGGFVFPEPTEAETEESSDDEVIDEGPADAAGPVVSGGGGPGEGLPSRDIKAPVVEG